MISVVHTTELDRSALAATRALPAESFAGGSGDDDAVFVLPGAASFGSRGELTCGWRDGDLW